MKRVVLLLLRLAAILAVSGPALTVSAQGEPFAYEDSAPQRHVLNVRASEINPQAQEHPEGRWDYFLTPDGNALRWEDVIMAGSSHGSTTSARFAKHQEVSRVVMFCGPRDQYQNWQALPSATPPNRYFGFSHVLDGGWTGDHYCRSWELLGLHQFGSIVNVDESRPPFGNSRRLISAANVKNDAKRAHSAVTPGGASPRDAIGKLLYEGVWRYLFTHPVDQTGDPVEPDPNCTKDHFAADVSE